MAQKISEEHLKELQQKVGAIQNLQTQIGGLEIQKHSALHTLAGEQEALKVLQDTFEKEYGKVSINIQDGSYEEIVEEAETEEA